MFAKSNSLLVESANDGCFVAEILPVAVRDQLYYMEKGQKYRSNLLSFGNAGKFFNTSMEIRKLLLALDLGS